MAYIKISTNEYPRYPGDIQIDNPEWEYGQPLPEDWAEVEDTVSPELGPTDVVESITAEEKSGKWYQKWTIKTLTEEEFDEMLKTRARNRLYFSLSMSQDELDYIGFSPNKIKEIDNSIDNIVISLLGGNDV